MNLPKRPNDITAAEIHNLVGDTPFILEIGAADGQTTEQFLAEMPDACIQCFEPDPRCIEAFKQRIDSNQVELHEVAISDRHEAATFHQSGGAVPGSREPCKDDWYLSGSLHRPTGHLIRDKVVKFPSKITVTTQPLDHFNCRDVDIIWADVQGAEARMILGAQATLRHTKWLYTEFYDTPQYDRQPDLRAILAFLPDWEPVQIYGDNVLLKNSTN